jgi:hypothetical protein
MTVHAAAFLDSYTFCGRKLDWIRPVEGVPRVATHKKKLVSVSPIPSKVTCLNCRRFI